MPRIGQVRAADLEIAYYRVPDPDLGIPCLFQPSFILPYRAQCRAGLLLRRAGTAAHPHTEADSSPDTRLYMAGGTQDFVSRSHGVTPSPVTALGAVSSPDPCRLRRSGCGSKSNPTPTRIASTPTSTPSSRVSLPFAQSQTSTVSTRCRSSPKSHHVRSAFDDGRTQLLLCVHGLLPISYRGASYNIPMAFWVTREYPRHPPIAYVVPTNDMLVKAGKYVDVSGRCNIDYIQHWERKDEVGPKISTPISLSVHSDFQGLHVICSIRGLARSLLA